MYALLGQDNIWLRYNYLKIWNLRAQNNLIEFLINAYTNQKLSYVFTVKKL